MKPRAAFTMIELLMVIMIVAILSVMLTVSFSDLVRNSRFNNAKTEVVDIIQKARSLSLSNILVTDTEPTSYYVLTFSGNMITLDAYGPTVDEGLDSVVLDSNYSFDTDLSVFYFPPYGDVCFDDPGCSSTDTTRDLILSDVNSSNTATFTINVNGGYVNVN